MRPREPGGGSPRCVSEQGCVGRGWESPPVEAEPQSLDARGGRAQTALLP